MPFSKKVSESETTITELMIPAFANFSGKIHGGTLLSLMDKVAYVCAAKHSGHYCVTVAVEGVEFFNPVEVGDLVSIQASVNYVGRTSMIIGMRIESLKPKTGVVTHTNSCYFTMAAKNEEGQLTEVPGLILENETQTRRFVEGKLIRKLSLEKRELLKSDLKNLHKGDILHMCEGEKCELSYHK
jgi:acyl-CoA hydrolase